MAVDHYLDWVGRKITTEDNIAELLCNRIAAIFNVPTLKKGDALPALWNWAFFVDPVPQAHIGPDGHPNVSGFIPGIEGYVRMWAGGRVNFIQPLKVGVDASRRSEIISVKAKEGRSGKLVFVTVQHEYYQQDELCIKEEQDIVYRPPAPVARQAEAFGEALDWSEAVVPSAALLFRYSAVTFNSHRIHYDWPYTTGEESYPDLVVHGPLIATLLVNAFVTANPSKRPTALAYRGVRPLTAEQSFQVGGRHLDEGRASLWAYNGNGAAHQAEIEFVDAAS